MEPTLTSESCNKNEDDLMIWRKPKNKGGLDSYNYLKKKKTDSINYDDLKKWRQS